MSSPREEKEREEVRKALERKFVNRITIAKDGRQYFTNKDYAKAAQRYHEYLEILSQTKKLTDIYQLNPSHFNSEKDTAEMFLISNLFFELCRIYEMTPKLTVAFQKCLNQFVKFTINQQYQVINSEMLRKYMKINKAKMRQPDRFNEAYAQIQRDSKGCFIATCCFGDNNYLTNELRTVKPLLEKSNLGKKFIEVYYRFSQKFIIENNYPRFRKIFITISKFPLFIIARVLILKRGTKHE